MNILLHRIIYGVYRAGYVAVLDAKWFRDIVRAFCR